MYDQDSFFSLSLMGRAGLLALSLTMALWCCLAARRLVHARALWVQVIVALAFYWAFVWLSPQVYFSYYHQLFPDLPRQWVTRWPNPERIARLLTFTERQTLAAHTSGALGWVMIAASVIKNTRDRRDAAN